MAFTYAQTQTLSIIPHVTGALSAIGSTWILYDITSDRKKWSSKPYYSLLFSMACFDVLSSISLGLSTWPIPSGSPDVYDPRGTVQTCSAQAFFIQANIASPLFNFCLSVYYLCLVRYGITERYIRHRVEPWMQGLTITFALSTSFVCLALGMFNDSSLWCWINALPKGCRQSYNNNSNGSDPNCVRGDGAEIFRWAFFFAPLWAAIVGTMVTMFMLWRAVRAQEDRASRWTSDCVTASQFAGGVPHPHRGQERDTSGLKSGITSIKQSIRAVFQGVKRDGGDGGGNASTNNSSVPGGGSSAVTAKKLRQMTLERDRSIKHHRKSNMVMWQAFRYVAAFWLTWLPATLNRLLQLSGRNVFWVFVLHSIFVPLQGAMNWCVYKYPQFYKWKEARRKARKKRRKQAEGVFGAESTNASIVYTRRFSGMSLESTRRKDQRLSHVSGDDDESIDNGVDGVVSSNELQTGR